MRAIRAGPVDAARPVVDRLVGVRVPSVVLSGGWESAFDIAGFALEREVVLYLYPGCGSAPGDGEHAARFDALQHRAFCGQEQDFRARQCRVVGISSQTKQAQRREGLESRVSHMLLCDPGLVLAAELDLPTFTRGGTDRYERLTLVARGGYIVKTFFPVSSPARNAAQVLAWLTLHADLPAVGDDAG